MRGRSSFAAVASPSTDGRLATGSDVGGADPEAEVAAARGALTTWATCERTERPTRMPSAKMLQSATSEAMARTTTRVERRPGRAEGERAGGPALKGARGAG